MIIKNDYVEIKRGPSPIRPNSMPFQRNCVKCMIYELICGYTSESLFSYNINPTNNIIFRRVLTLLKLYIFSFTFYGLWFHWLSPKTFTSQCSCVVDYQIKIIILNFYLSKLKSIGEVILLTIHIHRVYTLNMLKAIFELHSSRYIHL